MEKIQSKETGLWGKDPSRLDHEYVSGAMKITTVFNRYKREVPLGDKVVDSVVRTLEKDHNVKSSYCFVRNPLSVLAAVVSLNGIELTDKQKLAVVANTMRHHMLFLEADGGFSRSPISPFKGDAPLVSSLGLKEGDTNGTTQAIHTLRRMCYDLCGRAIPPIKTADTFYRRLGY